MAEEPVTLNTNNQHNIVQSKTKKINFGGGAGYLKNYNQHNTEHNRVKQNKTNVTIFKTNDFGEANFFKK